MSMPEYDITGRRILLVGAARGLGKGIALVLAEAGAEVAIASLNRASATAAADEIKAAGGKAVGYAADATRCADMERLAREVKDSFGPIDVLVNCVGDSISKAVVGRPGQDEEGMSEADWQYVMNVNLTQVFTGCRAFGPHFLQQQRGSIINISTSLSARRTGPMRVAYAAAKGGVISFTEALALEWAPYHVRVNSLAPGSFPDETQLTPEEYRRGNERWSKVPLGRAGKPREAGLLALYLASDASAFVTGQTWCIDGGDGIA